MRRARDLGFKAVEISEGTIDLEGDRRRRVIDCARSADLIAITEVGRKDPKNQPSAAEMADQALLDLEWGASWVVVEGRESGRSIGIYDEDGNIRSDLLEEIVKTAGSKLDWLVWEGTQQAAASRIDQTARRQCQSGQYRSKRLSWRSKPCAPA